MMTADGPRLLEYNVRMGDPETQPLMHRLDCDFVDALAAPARGELGNFTLSFPTRPIVCVVLASGGYPGKFDIGLSDYRYRKCRTRPEPPSFTPERGFNNGHLETSGGRVLGVTASGPDLPTAIDRAYTAVHSITYRKHTLQARYWPQRPKAIQ